MNLGLAARWGEMSYSMYEHPGPGPGPKQENKYGISEMLKPTQKAQVFDTNNSRKVSVEANEYIRSRKVPLELDKEKETKINK